MEARNMDLADFPDVLKRDDIRDTPLIPEEDLFDLPVLEQTLLAPGTRKQSGIDEAKDYIMKNLKVSNKEAQDMITFYDKTMVPQKIITPVQHKNETTYVIACHSGSPANYQQPPLGKINFDMLSVNFNTLVPDGKCLLMLRNKIGAGIGNIQDWIINMKNDICNGVSLLYPKKGYYDDRYLQKDKQREWRSGVYRCNSNLPFIDFDDPMFEATHANLFGAYKLSDIIMLIISEHLKSPEKFKKIKIVGAFCCGGVPDEADQLATIIEDLSVRDSNAKFKSLMDTVQLDYDDPIDFMNTMKAKGKTKQAKKNKKGEKKGTSKKAEKKGTSKKSGKKGTSKKSGKKGTLGVAKKQGIGKQKASKAKKSKKIKKIKSKKKSKNNN